MANTERETRPPAERMYSTAGAAEKAGLKPGTIQHYIRRGDLPADKLIGSNEYYICETDLNAWIAKRDKGKAMEKAADNSS